MTDPVVQDFVSTLVEDPADPPVLMLLNGYVGTSDDETRIRVYRSPDLSSWVDIPKEKIKFIKHVEPYGTSPLAEDLVWILREDARELIEDTAVSGASTSTPIRPTVTGGSPRPGTPSGTVVNINLGAGGKVSTASSARDDEDDQDDTFGGGGVTGVRRLYPPRRPRR